MDKRDLEKYGFAFSSEIKTKHSFEQILQMYLRSKSKGRTLTLSENTDYETLCAIKDFTDYYSEALLEADGGLKKDFISEYSLLSKDKKKLYIFSFTDASTPILINGVKNAKKKIYIMPENKLVETDKSLGLGAGPGATWITIDKKYIRTPCTVIKIQFEKPIELYIGTGAPITQN